MSVRSKHVLWLFLSDILFLNRTLSGPWRVRWTPANSLKLKFTTSTKFLTTGWWPCEILLIMIIIIYHLLGGDLDCKSVLQINKCNCVSCLFRLVGVFRMVLQKLIQDGHLEVMESLIDMNNTVLKVRVSYQMFIRS